MKYIIYIILGAIVGLVVGKLFHCDPTDLKWWSIVVSIDVIGAFIVYRLFEDE